MKVTKELVDKTIEEIKSLQTEIIRKTGGEEGIRDEGGLYHSVYKLQRLSHQAYVDPFLLGAKAYTEFSRKHHFVDGNKRISHVAAKMMMLRLGFLLKIEYKDAVSFIIKIAEHNSCISYGRICEWIKQHSVKIQEEEKEKYLRELTDV